MRFTGIAVFAATGLIAALGTAVFSGTSADRPAEAVVERGRYLVTVIGCNECHTPLRMGPNGPEPDMSRMLSGHPETVAIESAPDGVTGPWMMAAATTMTAFAGPWGVSFAANLTPDENTGIGIWSEDLFVKTLRTGRHWGTSRPILPPMPWQSFSQMTDDDLKAIYAYLRTVKPVVNHVPAPIEAGPVVQ
jgi:mono/diheme cytochrome c family protein